MIGLICSHKRDCSECCHSTNETMIVFNDVPFFQEAEDLYFAKSDGMLT